MASMTPSASTSIQPTGSFSVLFHTLSSLTSSLDLNCSPQMGTAGADRAHTGRQNTLLCASLLPSPASNGAIPQVIVCVRYQQSEVMVPSLLGALTDKCMHWMGQLSDDVGIIL